MQELWGMLASAQSNVSGVPQQLLDEAAEALKAKQDAEAAIKVSAVCRHWKHHSAGNLQMFIHWRCLPAGQETCLPGLLQTGTH